MKPQPRYHPGDKIGGRYQVHQALLGGMGEVYLCLDLETTQPYALKTFQQRHLANPKLRVTFEHEVAAWIALEKHPNIVRCFFLDTPDNQPFIFLEWIAGHQGQSADLRGWLRRGPLDLQLALDLIIDICRGLIHANQKRPGLVHCDLKPENILVAQGPVAKITDFGLAQIVQAAGLEVTGATENTTAGRQSLLGQGGVVGTPPYMAPEQWRGEALDARTDIYALGCILYELLTGRWPFVGSTVPALRRQHLQAAIPILPEQDGWPAVLNDLLHRCLAKERTTRFASAETLLAALATVYQQRFGRQPASLAPTETFTAIDYNNRGMTYLQLARYTEALADLNQAIRFAPEMAPAYANRGIAWAAQQQYAAALTDHNQALQLDPHNPPLYAGRGDTYRQMARYAEALADYNQALALDPDYAQAYYNRGNTYYRLEQYEQALADHTRALELEPNSAGAYHNRGNTYDKLQRYGEALADYTRALQLDPSYAQAYNSRGITYTKLQRYAEALADFDQAIQIDAGYANAYYNRTKAQIALGHDDQALADYTHVLQLQPDDAVTYVERAQLHAHLQHYAQALADYTAAIQQGAGDPQVYLDRGVVYLNLERYADALADFHWVLQREPDNAQAHANRGLSYDRLGQVEEALADYTRAIQLDPALAPAYLNLGALLANQGALEEALTYLAKAAQLGLAEVADPVVAQIQAQLQTESAPRLDTLQRALKAFQKARSADEMQRAVAEFPYLVDAAFIAVLEEDLMQQVAPQHRAAFAQRLAWLHQMTER